jgi:8-oxo-dGTP pyrophosphatase MutT (NUDIX family)
VQPWSKDVPNNRPWVSARVTTRSPTASPAERVNGRQHLSRTSLVSISALDKSQPSAPPHDQGRRRRLHVAMTTPAGEAPLQQHDTTNPPRPGPAPSFSLRIPPSLARFNVPPRDFLLSSGESWDGVAIGALVFCQPDPSHLRASPSAESHIGPETKVLLIQRAKTDSLPDKWEVPSGVVSGKVEKDATVAAAVARELWEETGLTATALVRLVAPPLSDEHAEGGNTASGEDRPTAGGFVFRNSTRTKVFCRFVFEVDLADEEGTAEDGVGRERGVTLNPWEHQDFVWATEEEVRKLEVGQGEWKRALDFTSDHLRRLILEGFGVRGRDGSR